MKVTIIGLGLIGGSMGLELKGCGFASEVYGVDASPENAAKAKELKLVDTVLPLNEAVGLADLVIVATPVNIICGLLPQILDCLAKGVALTDVGSTKERIAKAVASHSKREQLVLSHPMAGTENSGPEAALRGLFQQKTAVICDQDESDANNVSTIQNMYRALGMRLVYMSSTEHDLHAAYVSHLSHISSFVLANTVLDVEKNVSNIFNLAGGGFESTVRLAKSSPDMWVPIFEQNHQNVVTALEAYIKHLQVFHKSLVDKKVAETRALLEEANQIRRVLQNIRTLP